MAACCACALHACALQACVLRLHALRGSSQERLARWAAPAHRSHSSSNPLPHCPTHSFPCAGSKTWSMRLAARRRCCPLTRRPWACRTRCPSWTWWRYPTSRREPWRTGVGGWVGLFTQQATTGVHFGRPIQHHEMLWFMARSAAQLCILCCALRWLRGPPTPCTGLPSRLLPYSPCIPCALSPPSPLPTQA